MSFEPDNYPQPNHDRFRPPPTQYTSVTLEDTQPVITIHESNNFISFSWQGLFVTLMITVLMLAAGGLIAMAALINDDETTGEQVTARVSLNVDSTSYTLRTGANTVSELLADQAIIIEDGDRLSLPGDTPIADGLIIHIDRAHTIAVTVDAQTSVIRTPETNPLLILQNAGFTLQANDRVYIDGREVPQPQLATWESTMTNLMVRRALAVRIIDNGLPIEQPMPGGTVGDALYEAGIELFVADTVMPDLSTPLIPDMTIIITRSRPLIIIADGERIETRTSAATIGEALVEAGMALYGLDYTFPAEDAPIVANTSVRVIRVTEEILTETEAIPFETVYQADANAPLDTRRVAQTGQEGQVQRTIRVRYENDVEVERVLETETTVTEKRDQVIAYGTQLVVRTVDTPGGPVEYWRKLRVYATSYHPAALGGDDVTAIGMKLQHGVVGIDPNIIAYRTSIYVPGYGVGVAADTGMPRSNPYWIDLGYSDEDWFNWHEWVDIYLLTPAPAEIDYFLPATAQGGPVP